MKSSSCLFCVLTVGVTVSVIQLRAGMNTGCWGNRQRLGVVGSGCSASRGGDGWPHTKINRGRGRMLLLAPQPVLEGSLALFNVHFAALRLHVT